MTLKKYKEELRKRHISHWVVADYIGHSRETVTLWLNGNRMIDSLYYHICEEVEELLDMTPEEIKLLKLKLQGFLTRAEFLEQLKLLKKPALA